MKKKELLIIFLLAVLVTGASSLFPLRIVRFGAFSHGTGYPFPYLVYIYETARTITTFRPLQFTLDLILWSAVVTLGALVVKKIVNLIGKEKFFLYFESLVAVLLNLYRWRALLNQSYIGIFKKVPPLAYPEENFAKPFLGRFLVFAPRPLRQYSVFFVPVPLEIYCLVLILLSGSLLFLLLKEFTSCERKEVPKINLWLGILIITHLFTFIWTIPVP